MSVPRTADEPLDFYWLCGCDSGSSCDNWFQCQTALCNVGATDWVWWSRDAPHKEGIDTMLALKPFIISADDSHLTGHWTIFCTGDDKVMDSVYPSVNRLLSKSTMAPFSASPNPINGLSLWSQFPSRKHPYLPDWSCWKAWWIETKFQASSTFFIPRFSNAPDYEDEFGSVPDRLTSSDQSPKIMTEWY